MSGECVYACRHPLWGGAGECITADDPTVDDSCLCDAGYASRDSFGSPSCVPFNVLVGLFVTVALVETVTTTVVLWFLGHHFFALTESERRAPKAFVRVRLIISSSVSSGAAAVAFWIAVAGGGAVPLLEGGNFFMIFGLSYPAGMFAGLQVAEMWLDHLPPPLVKPGSTLEKLKVAAKERNLFFWGGLASFGSVFMLSMLSLVFGRRLVSSALHLVLAMSTMSMVIGFIFVAVFLTRAIDRASAKSPQSWHTRAKHNIRVEAGSLIVAGVVYTTSVIFLEMTHEGGSTPLIPLAVMLLLLVCVHTVWTSAPRLMVGNVAHVAVVNTSKPVAGKQGGVRSSVASLKTSRVPSSFVSTRSPAVFVRILAQPKKAMVGGEDRGTLAPITVSVGPRLTSETTGSTSGRAAKNKIIPVATSEDHVLPFE